MRVEKFRAETIKEATDKVKAVFGPDAMIVSTKKIARNGKNDLFEIAAVSGDNDIPIENTDRLGDVKAELMSIKEMIYLQNHSVGVLETLMMTPSARNLYIKLI